MAKKSRKKAAKGAKLLTRKDLVKGMKAEIARRQAVVLLKNATAASVQLDWSNPARAAGLHAMAYGADPVMREAAWQQIHKGA